MLLIVSTPEDAESPFYAGIECELSEDGRRITATRTAPKLRRYRGLTLFAIIQDAHRLGLTTQLVD